VKGDMDRRRIGPPFSFTNSAFYVTNNLSKCLQVLSGGTAVNIGIWGHATAENIEEEGWDPEAMQSAYEHLDAQLAHPGIVGPVQEKVLEAWQEQGLGPNNGVTPEHIVRCRSLVDCSILSASVLSFLMRHIQMCGLLKEGFLQL
jgi:hypothetical protein